MVRLEQLEDRVVLSGSSVTDGAPVAPVSLDVQAQILSSPQVMTSAEQIAGPMPLPTTLAWFTWYENLKQARLAYSLQPRTSTFYFSATGNDTTGLGTEASPWQSLTKAQWVLDNTGGNVAILFKRGDEFEGNVGLNVYQEHVTVGAYGDSNLPKPLISAFTIKFNGGWTQVPGTNSWSISAPNQIGWIRDATNDTTRLSAFTNVLTDSQVAATPRSWLWDGATLYLNPGAGVNPNTINYEAVGNVNDVGVDVRGDGSIVMDIRADGWGCVANTGYQTWGISLGPSGTASVVALNTEAYYNGRHGISIDGYGQSSGGFAMVLNSITGYTNGTAQGVTQFNTFQPNGGIEAIWDGNTVRFGKLPDTSLIGGGADTSPAFFGHRGGNATGNIALYINMNSHIVRENLPGATYSSGRVLVEPTNINGDDNDLSSLRAFVVNYNIEHNGVKQFELVPKHVYINNRFDFNPTTLSDFVTRAGGWHINTIWTVYDMVAARRYFMAGSSSPTARFLNNYFLVDGPENAQFQNWELLASEPDQYSYAANNIFGRTNAREFQIGIENSGSNLIDNAYYRIVNYGTESYSNDPYLINLSTMPAPGVAPLLSSGLVGMAKRDPFGVTLEYDFYGHPRNLLAPTIGPIEFDWNSLPTTAAGQYYIVPAGRDLQLHATGSPTPGALYEWDINNDGIFGDAVGFQPLVAWDQIRALGLGNGLHDVRLRTTILSTVTTSAPAVLLVVDRPTYASAGPDLIGGPGENIQFDASASYTFNPDDVLQYSWDINGDGIFGDATGVNPMLTPAQYASLNLVSETVYATRVRVWRELDPSVVVESAPIQFLFGPPLVADAGGPYSATEGIAVQLTAASNPVGVVTYEWDFDNDGFYDDATGRIVNYIAPDNGVYTIRLRVSVGDRVETDTTTVTAGHRAPFATLSLPAISPRGAASITLNVQDSPADLSQLFYFELDYNADGIWDETMNAKAGTTIVRPINQTGFRPVLVRATDKDGIQGGIGLGLTTVTAVEKIGNTLYWYGSTGDDSVTFTPQSGNNFLITETKIFGAAVNTTYNITNVTQMVVLGREGNDLLDLSTLTSQLPTIVGGLGVDTILGSQANDVIYGDESGGEGVRDYIDAGAGNDLIYADGSEGGSGARDTIYGGEGNDAIVADGGEGAADSILGEEGNDTIDSGGGDDYVDGGDNNDLLYGSVEDNGTNDTILGGNGDDVIFADGGFVIDYADVLAAGLDSISGGAGNDLIVADSYKPTSQLDAELIAAEWHSSHTYAQKVAYLTGTPGGLNNGAYLLPEETLFDDLLVDIALGDGGQDLVFLNGEILTE